MPTRGRMRTRCTSFILGSVSPAVSVVSLPPVWFAPEDYRGPEEDVLRLEGLRR